jgi:uncharacterized membrane protein YwzB
MSELLDILILIDIELSYPISSFLIDLSLSAGISREEA